MGMQSMLQRSLLTSANAIFKFHAAALEEQISTVYIYPIMDGLYAVSVDAEAMKSFFTNFFSRLAVHFIEKDDNEHRFLPRAAFAYGDIVHGEDVPSKSSKVFENHENYKSNLLIGPPVVRAHLTESSAPPFGISLDQTADLIRTDKQRKASHLWWPWYQNTNVQLITELMVKMDKYFEWCSERSGAIDYDSSRINLHRKVAKEYFTCFQ
jgi:hypothetical protein